MAQAKKNRGCITCVGTRQLSGIDHRQPEAERLFTYSTDILRKVAKIMDTSHYMQSLCTDRRIKGMDGHVTNNHGPQIINMQERKVHQASNISDISFLIRLWFNSPQRLTSRKQPEHHAPPHCGSQNKWQVDRRDQQIYRKCRRNQNSMQVRDSRRAQHKA